MESPINQIDHSRLKLLSGEVVPPFDLPSTTRKTISPWRYKQKKNLVIFFHHGGGCGFCRKKLVELAGIYNRLKDQEAEVLAVSLDSLEENGIVVRQLKLPFPMLSDPKGETVEQYTSIEGNRLLPGVFITDRYGGLFRQEVKEEATDLLDADEIVEWLKFIESQCPECSHL